MTWIDRPFSARGARLTSLLALASALAAPGVARAESTADAAAARALFAEGRRLADQGKFNEACPKFQESLRLKPGIGTRFNLADCWEKSGRTASAWGEFLEVATAAKAQGQKDREVVARDRARALEAKLSYLVIETEETDPELRVTRDGAEVGRGAFGTAVPVDPGLHAIEASAPTKKPWSSSEDVKVGQKSRVAIPKLSAREASAPAAPPPANAAAAPSEATSAPLATSASAGNAPLPPAADSAASGGLGAQRAIAIGAGGLGVVGVVAGFVFLGGYNSKNDEAKKLCTSGSCSGAEISQHQQLIEDAKDRRTLSYVGFGVGGALLATGAVLFFTAPSGERSAGLRISPIASPSEQGLSVSGRF